MGDLNTAVASYDINARIAAANRAVVSSTTGAAGTQTTAQETGNEITYGTTNEVKAAEIFLSRVINDAKKAGKDFLGGEAKEYKSGAGKQAIKNSSQLEAAEKRLELLKNIVALCQQEEVTVGAFMQALEIHGRYHPGAKNSPLEQELKGAIKKLNNVYVNKRALGSTEKISGQFEALTIENSGQYLDREISDPHGNGNKASPTDLLRAAVDQEIATVATNIEQFSGKSTAINRGARKVQEVLWSTWAAGVAWTGIHNAYKGIKAAVHKISPSMAAKPTWGGWKAEAYKLIKLPFMETVAESAAKNRGSFGKLLRTKVPYIAVAIMAIDVLGMFGKENKDSAAKTALTEQGSFFGSIVGGIKEAFKGFAGYA